ncbi:MAG: family 43 glycosylhydrolase [bacterium]|nr:family 43 glycosylhydrolase [bacterium]
MPGEISPLPGATLKEPVYDSREGKRFEPQTLPFTKEQLVRAEWLKHPDNPLILPLPHTANYLADPTWLPPSHTPDGKYHLIAPAGPDLNPVRLVKERAVPPKLVEFTSEDGIKWDFTGKTLVEGATRPYLFHEGDTYYLFYSQVTRFVPGTKYLDSHIKMISSKDMQTWSEPTEILRPSKDQNNVVGNPSIVKVNGRYQMHHSGGKAYLTDCLFTEPESIYVAESDNVQGPYTLRDKPVITPTDGDPHMNVGAGSIKVYNTIDGYLVGFQNTIFKRKRFKTESAIKVIWSKDGIMWEGQENEHVITPDRSKHQTFAYACDVRWDEKSGELRMYYNTRRGRSLGVEEISLAVAQFPHEIDRQSGEGAIEVPIFEAA